MLVPVLLFILGLLLLIKGGDWFVDGAVNLAKRFRLPELLIGATVVSIGTTLPEVMVSATSAATGHGEIAYGNAIGSIICNTALISAISLVFMPGKVNGKTFRAPVFFYFLAATFYAAVSYLTGNFSRPIGIALLVLFVIYMVYTVLSMMKERTADTPEGEEEAEDEDKPLPKFLAFLEPVRSFLNEKKQKFPLFFDLLALIVGAAAIAWGANLLVNNGTLIAEALGVPESVIALTFVALGTSLPELVTAISSLTKGHGSLSLGNVIGANLFNLVLVAGLSITIRPFSVPAGTTLFGINSSLLVEIPLTFLVMAIMTLPALLKNRLYRWQGIALLVLYTAFCALQFVMPALA